MILLEFFSSVHWSEFFSRAQPPKPVFETLNLDSSLNRETVSTVSKGKHKEAITVWPNYKRICL